MAKKAESKEVAEVKQGGAVALPSFLDGYRGPTGAESIDNEDVNIPRIKIAQSLTPQVKEGILEDGTLFINVSGEDLGRVIKIVPIVRSKEFILWRPRKDGGGILARAKPVNEDGTTRYKWDKPNQTFEVKVEGKTKVEWKTKEYIDEDGLGEWGSEIPGNEESGIAATAHHNYIVRLPEHGNMLAALSLSRSSAKRAKDFNALLKMSSAPIFARVFTVTSKQEKNDQGDFFNVVVTPDGFVATEAEFNANKEIALSLLKTGYTVDQSDEDTGEAGGDGKL